MIEYNFREIKSLINDGELNFYNFYNIDTPTEGYYTVKYYKENNQDNIDERKQDIHIVFTDIELYVEEQTDKKFDEGHNILNAVTFFSNFEKIYHAYILLNENNKNKIDIENSKNNIIEKLKDKEYINDEEVRVYFYYKETKMIYDFWTYIKELDPAVLTGWNSDRFDYPYIYRRSKILLNNDKNKTDKFISKFEYVDEKSNGFIDIPEFVICDLLNLYKPRDDGGLNYGSKRKNYRLDLIADEELKLKKIEYQKASGNLNELYNDDPELFILYNIVDVVLCKKLNDKLQHIELHNNIRRLMKTSFSKSMIGNSAYYYGYIFYNINKQNQYLRFGISKERNKNIDIEETKNLYSPKTKTGELQPVKIEQQDYQKVVSKYDGAYVKQSYSQIISDGRLIIDLDASSLYPSMMLEGNISFDSYRFRIVPKIAYKFLNNLSKDINNPINKKETILDNVYEMVVNHVDKNNLVPKGETVRFIYYTFNYLLTKIYESNEKLENIFYPKNDKQQILLNYYLIPIIDILWTIHPKRKEYDEFIYDYLFRGQDFYNRHNEVLIILNPSQPNKYIKRFKVDEALEFTKKYSMNIAGTGFEKHENYKGILTSMLEYMFRMRKEYKKKMKNYEGGSEGHEFYNSRQKSIKIAMNSGYGVSGLKSFDFSNHIIAQSITTSAKLTIKLGLHLSNEYIKANY